MDPNKPANGQLTLMCLNKFIMKIYWENYLFGTETNQSFLFGMKKIELSYLTSSSNFLP